jgi:hypothetical protein
MLYAGSPGAKFSKVKLMMEIPSNSTGSVIARLTRYDCISPFPYFAVDQVEEIRVRIVKANNGLRYAVVIVLVEDRHHRDIIDNLL